MQVAGSPSSDDATARMGGVSADIERIFVGWRRPGLDAAVDVLWDRFADAEVGLWDLSEVLLAVPTRRAARQLLSRLVLRAEAEGVRLGVPRQILTPRMLLDSLCPPTGAVPDELLRALVWADALRAWHLAFPGVGPGKEDGSGVPGASGAHTSGAPGFPAGFGGGELNGSAAHDNCPLLRRPPAADDGVGWLRVAERVASSHALTTGQGLSFAEVCRRIGDWPGGHPDEGRWCALAEVEEIYESALASAGMVDRDLDLLSQLGFAGRGGSSAQEGRMSGGEFRPAAHADAAVEPRALVLIGMAEISPVLRAAVQRFQGHIIAIVLAPPVALSAGVAEGGVGIDRFGSRVRPESRCASGPGKSPIARSGTPGVQARAETATMPGVGRRDPVDAFQGVAAATAEGGGATGLKENPSSPSAAHASRGIDGSAVDALASDDFEAATSALPPQAFDDLGTVQPAFWRSAAIAYPGQCLHMVDKPLDQADLALTLIEQHTEPLTAADVLIVTADAELIPTLSRRADLAGVRVRDASGRPVASTCVFSFLTAAEAFLRSRETSDLLALLRHPDVERYVDAHLKEETSGAHVGPAARISGVDVPGPRPAGGVRDGGASRRAADAVIREMASLFDDPATNEAGGADATNTALDNSAEELIADFGSSEDSPLPSDVEGPAWWLEWVDDWARERRPGPLPLNPDRWPGIELEEVDETSPGVPTIRAVGRAVFALLDGLADEGRQPLAVRADMLADVLVRLFAGRSWRPQFAPHAEMIGACRCVHSAICTLIQLAEGPNPLAEDLARDLLEVTGAEVIELVCMLTQAERLPHLPDADAIDAVGWLQVQLEDAPLIIVTGFNEGYLPEAMQPDPILPDRLRQFLGLPNSETRFARDVFLMSSLLGGDRRVHLISGRLARDGDPLRPSRLLFNGPTEEVLARVRKVLGHEDPVPRQGDADRPDSLCEDGPARIRRPAWPRAGEPTAEITSDAGAGAAAGIIDISRFRPMPRPLEIPAVRRMSVTAFRVYLASPYLFLLQHVLRLAEAADLETELNHLEFGSLMHELLREFAWSDRRDATREEHIYEYLSSMLDDRLQMLFGDAPPPAILIQAEQMRLRFEGFAMAQAERRKAGWRIVDAEWPQDPQRVFPFDVDGLPCDLTGRIDRIDHHPVEGWCLIDYKAGNSVRNPAQTHRRADGTWVDLQLPLYAHLAREVTETRSGEVRMCYFALPAQVEDCGTLDADWTADDIESAHTCARDVIRRIRSEDYFKPGSAPPEEGVFGALCGATYVTSGEPEPPMRAPGLGR